MVSNTDGLKKLKVLSSSQIGGKGSMRRKVKTVKAKKNPRNEFVNKMRSNISSIELPTEEITLINNYLEIYCVDFVGKLRKDDRKNNKSNNVTTIRKTLLEYFKDNKYSDELANYCEKHLNDGALNTFNRFLDHVIDIIKSKEYNDFNNFKVNLDENIISDSFKLLNLDYSKPIMPSVLRHIYKEKLGQIDSISTEDKAKENTNELTKEKIDTSFYTILTLIKNSYKEKENN